MILVQLARLVPQDRQVIQEQQDRPDLQVLLDQLALELKLERPNLIELVFGSIQELRYNQNKNKEEYEINRTLLFNP